MSNDQNDGKKENPERKEGLADEAVEQIKKEILFGVGYGKPPQHTRFKKGQCGNPKGRPKAVDLDLDSDRSANAIALKEAERLITVREGATTREMPAINAVARKQIATAFGGSAYAQKHLTERYHWAELERRHKIAKEIEVFTYYVESRRAEIAEAKTNGQPPPNPLPHPDDVVIDREKGVRFIGPLCEEDVARLEHTLKFRDVLLLQHALDEREVGDPNSEDILDRPGSAYVFAETLNNGVPERFRLSDIKILLKLSRYKTMPKRALLKELYGAWRAVGAPARRGMTFPTIRFAKQVMESINQAIEKLRNGE